MIVTGIRIDGSINGGGDEEEDGTSKEGEWMHEGDASWWWGRPHLAMADRGRGFKTRMGGSRDTSTAATNHEGNG
jgi:hypothetical protein